METEEGQTDLEVENVFWLRQNPYQAMLLSLILQNVNKKGNYWYTWSLSSSEPVDEIPNVTFDNYKKLWETNIA